MARKKQQKCTKGHFIDRRSDGRAFPCRVCDRERKREARKRTLPKRKWKKNDKEKIEAVHAMFARIPDSHYRTLMLEAKAEFEAWDKGPKRSYRGKRIVVGKNNAAA